MKTVHVIQKILCGLSLSFTFLLSARAEWAPGGLLAGTVDDVDWGQAKQADLFTMEAERGVTSVFNQIEFGQPGCPWKEHQARIYKGQVYLDGPCWFFEYVDDGVRVKIGNTVVMEETACWTRTKKRFAAPTPGWYDIEILIWNGGGNCLGRDETKDGQMSALGVCWEDQEPQSMKDCYAPLDPGDGSRFRYDDGSGFTRRIVVQFDTDNIPDSVFPLVYPCVGESVFNRDDHINCITAPSFIFEEKYYRSNGYVLEKKGQDGEWGVPVTNLTDQASFQCNDPESVRITWLYQLEGYSLSVESNDERMGKVLVSPPPSIEGRYYTIGTSVRLEAVPEGGFNFQGWEGSQESSKVLEIVMDQPRNYRAVFKCSLLYWAGGSQGEWGGSGVKWQTEEGEKSPWINGSIVRFTNGVELTVSPGAGLRTGGIQILCDQPFSVTGKEITLLGDAEIVSTNGAPVDINCSITGIDGLKVIHGQILRKEAFVTAADSLCFPNVSLDDLGVIEAEMGGRGLHNGSQRDSALPCSVRSYTDHEGNSCRSVLYQALDDSSTKCVKVIFTEKTDGVYARSGWEGHARHIGEKVLGMDFDRMEDWEELPLATTMNNDGCGICGLEAQWIPSHFIINGETRFTGDLVLDRGSLSFGPEGCLGMENGVAMFSGNIRNNGQLYLPPRLQRVKGKVSGYGEIVLKPTGPTERIKTPGFLTRDGILLAENHSLADLTFVRARACGGWNTRRQTYLPFAVTRSEDGATMVLDMQNRDDGFVRGMKLKLIQVDSCIYGKPTERGEGLPVEGWHTWQTDLGKFQQNEGIGFAENDSQWGTGLTDIELFFHVPVASFYEGWEGATGDLRVEGDALLNVEREKGLPKESGTFVGNGGEICLAIRSDSKRPIYVLPGGTLSLGGNDCVYNPWDRVRKLYLEGGTVDTFTVGHPNNEETKDSCGNYLYYLDVLNGGTFVGNSFLTTKQQDMLLRVRGNAPFIQKAGIKFNDNKDSTNVYSFVMNVDDVTSDPSPDCLITGPLNGGKDLRLVKKGAGKVLISGEKNTLSGTVLSLEGGCVELGESNVLGKGVNILFNGGVLAPGNMENELGSVDLQKSSTLQLGEGVICFDNSSTNQWGASGQILTIEGRLGIRSVRFGTDSTGLTKDQLRQIQIGECPSNRLYLDSDGWLRNASKLATILLLN